jgi:hypothetical protein
VELFDDHEQLAFGDATIAAHMERTGIEYLSSINSSVRSICSSNSAARATCLRYVSSPSRTSASAGEPCRSSAVKTARRTEVRV